MVTKEDIVGHRRLMSAPVDDSDIEDLIAKSPTKLEIDNGNNNNNGGFLIMTPCYCIINSLRLFNYKCPCISKCIMLLMSIGFIAFLSNTVFSPYQKMGIMGADYSAITSAYDLSLSKVDHWCIQGDNDSCKCEDPLEPNSRSEFKSWNAAHKANVADVSMYKAIYGENPSMIDESTGKSRPPIDVAFLGESVVEAMDGRWLGKRVVRAINKGNEGTGANGKPDIGKVFERMFRKEKGGPVEGVALGIAGDNTANVLWRLQHDEMPYDFNPKVWWLVLGMNDLTRMQCSEEIVVLGILRIVEEIRLRKPDAKIVINGLLPMIDYQSMQQPTMADVADFKREKDAVKENMEIEKGLKKFKEGVRMLRSKKKKKRTKKQRQYDEDHATEGKDLEKALERRKKILERKDKRMKNKAFKDNEKYRPKKPLSPFLPMIKKKVLPPVWPSVHLINDKLKEFCSKHDSITFFDATPIFASEEGGGRHHLHNELISPRGHPSELGFAVWEGHIMGRLHKLMMEKQADIESDQTMKNDDDFNDDLDDEEGYEQHAQEMDAEVAGAGEEGEGSHHVSEGKENSPPKPVLEQQTSRDPPAEEEEEGEAEAEDDDEEAENAGEESVSKPPKESYRPEVVKTRPEPIPGVVRTRTKPVSNNYEGDGWKKKSDDDDDNEEDDDGEDDDEE